MTTAAQSGTSRTTSTRGALTPADYPLSAGLRPPSLRDCPGGGQAVPAGEPPAAAGERARAGRAECAVRGLAGRSGHRPETGSRRGDDHQRDLLLPGRAPVRRATEGRHPRLSGGILQITRAALLVGGHLLRAGGLQPCHDAPGDGSERLERPDPGDRPVRADADPRAPRPFHPGGDEPGVARHLCGEVFQPGPDGVATQGRGPAHGAIRPARPAAGAGECGPLRCHLLPQRPHLLRCGDEDADSQRPPWAVAARRSFAAGKLRDDAAARCDIRAGASTARRFYIRLHEISLVAGRMARDAWRNVARGTRNGRGIDGCRSVGGDDDESGDCRESRGAARVAGGGAWNGGGAIPPRDQHPGEGDWWGELAAYINQTLKSLRHLDPAVRGSSREIPKVAKQLAEIIKTTEEATNRVLEQAEADARRAGKDRGGSLADGGDCWRKSFRPRRQPNGPLPWARPRRCRPKRRTGPWKS